MSEETRLAERIRQAAAERSPLAIHGGRSKAFYGRSVPGAPLDLTAHAGIVAYEPTELTLTARAGTPLTEIETLLAEHGQMLPFEPPHFGPSATLGGMLAAGLSGPRRPWAGAVRDALLGVKLINGRGEVLTFGGQVMKNVAGYDVSRLMAGSLGTLAVILEATVKVLPRPAVERTLTWPVDATEAARRLIVWGRRPLPLSASLHHAGRLWVRLSGSHEGVAAARAVIGGEATDPTVWIQVREQTLPFFQSDAPLWRVSLPAAAPPLELLGEELIEWGGALRWLRTSASAESVRRRAATLGGHATLFRGHDGEGQVFQPLPPALLDLHRRLKAAFDPHGIFNPGRLYPEL